MGWFVDCLSDLDPVGWAVDRPFYQTSSVLLSDQIFVCFLLFYL